MAIPRINDCVIVLTVLASSTAMARDAGAVSAPAIRQACTADYQSYCTGEEPSLPIETACLRQHFLSLSAECQSALGTLEQDSGEKSPDDEAQ